MLFNQFKWGIWVLLLPLFYPVYGDDYSAEMATLRAQINSYKEKIEETRKKTEYEVKKAVTDSSSYATYLSDYTKRKSRIDAEMDSLSSLSSMLQGRRDSLAKVESLIHVQKESYISQTGQLSEIVKQYCRQMLDTVGPYEKFNISKQTGALKFLESELTAGTVGVAEGLERYWQIVTQIEQASGKIETWTGASPVPAIHGDVTFLRIGFVWLACAGNDNNSAYIYNENQKNFERVKNADQVAAIYKAIKLQSGMAAPELVSLPFRVDLNSTPGGK